MGPLSLPAERLGGCAYGGEWPGALRDPQTHRPFPADFVRFLSFKFVLYSSFYENKTSWRVFITTFPVTDHHHSYLTWMRHPPQLETTEQQWPERRKH